MSFIIAVHVNEGIVLASDRRTTYTNTMKGSDGTIIQRIGIHTTDSTDKTFICSNGAGISTCGTASLNGKPISGYVRDMIRSRINQDTKISEIPIIILNYFKGLASNLDTSFLVAGYEQQVNGSREQSIYKVDLMNSDQQKIDTTLQGATWDGESLTLTRLIQNVALKRDDGTYTDLPYEDILWGYFTLQDAVDFARYAVETTIKTMRFKNVIETVGGDVDILIITPDETRWLQKAILS